jgi:hypothetical protein
MTKNVLLRACLLFYRNKPEAVEVTFAGKCLYLIPYNFSVFCLCSLYVPDA